MVATLDEQSTLEANKVVARRLLVDDISKGDERAAEEIIHPDFFDHTNPPGMQHGLAGHKDLVAERDRVVARTVFRGTHLGDFFGIPASGKRVEVHGVHIMRIADGKVAEHWGSNDDLGLMRQIGAIPG
jgi:predicted SnoaL-like aldol condensation-catalyzing enzyme